MSRSIKEAFPNAVISEIRGISQRTRPDPPYALISISYASIVDGRIRFVTRSGESLNLRNRSLSHTSNSTNVVTLSVQEPSSEEDVGDVCLVGFGSTLADSGRYEAVCEGACILCSTQSTQVHTKGILPGKYLQ